MASQKLDDCYFYFYSSCAKGEECPYRHCQQALGTEIVCSLWREGRCFRNNCKFRHMESRINRSGIQCYWENQPGGCRKPHCVFLHRKLRNGIQPIKTNSGLILPTLDGKASPNLPDRNDQANAISMNSPAAECLSNDGDDYLPNPSSIPVPRLVLSFDEESDTESVSSTPVKVPSNDASSDLCSSAKNNLSSKFSGSTAEKDLGIKTLEQIRMEKIHKESNYYYSDETPGKSVTHRSLEISRNSTLLDETMFCYSGYEAPSLDSPRVIEHAKEYYPPQSDFISLPVSTSLDKNIPAPIKDTPHHTMDKESDLRGRLYNKRTLPSRKVNSEKQVVTTFRRQNKTTEESSNPLDFKIKTLDEIRRERESKRGNEDYSNENLTEENKAPNNNGAQKPSKKLRITRRPKDSFETSLLAAKVEPVTSLNAETGPQLVINGVQNLSDDHSQSTTVHCMDRKLLSLSQGKRKTEDVNLERQNKFLKMVPADVHDPTNKPASRNGSIHQHEEKEKQIVKSLGPFLRRPKAVTSHSTPQRSATLSELSANISSTASPILPNSIKEEDDRLSTDLIETTLKNSDTSLLNDSTCSVTSTTANQELTELDNAIDVKEEKVLERSVSVDEFDSFFNETDMNVDDIEDSSNGDDILLEVEQFLDS